MDQRHQKNASEIQDGRSIGRIYPLTEALSRAATKTPSKTRSLSDSTPALSPSPRFKEPSRKASDDNAILSTPSKLSRALDLSGSGLTLQMPPRDMINFANSAGVPTPGGYPAQIDPRDIYGSPSTVLPRHSRGLDFSRAATHLHHSTIAEQSSPESSPTITQKSLASRRPSSQSMMLDSPRIGSGWIWGGSVSNDRPFMSRSLGSTTAMLSDSSNSDSDDDNLMQEGPAEDVVIATPQVNKFDAVNTVTPFGAPRATSLMGWEGQSPIPIPHAFTNIRHGKRPRDRGRHSSDSADSRSRRTTPDPQLSRESTISNYFGRDAIMQTPASRRESLSLGTNHLHITSSNEEADESGSSGNYANPGVIRRPVTRRSNLLPKTKGFARIRAQLQEENTPVDSEAKREAEVVKQVNANYQGHDWGTATTAPPSPDLIPTVPSMHRESSSMSDIDGLGLDCGMNFGSRIGPEQRRGSVQKEFWANMLNRMQTPPPQSGNRPRSSSGMSDIGMESPQVSTPPSSSSVAGTATTVTAMPAPDGISPYAAPSNMPTLADVSRKVNKRRRDDDFDLHAIKRRAVSPGLSIQSSPVAGQSPVSNGGGWWGQPKPTRELSNGSTVPEDRPGSISQGPASVGPKRVGLQGMTDTSDGLMKMSIE